MGMSIASADGALRVRQHPPRAVRAALQPAAAPVLAPDPRPASLQPRGAAARRQAGRADGRRVPARLGLLALVPRAGDRARGLGGLVGRPGGDLGVPARVPRRVPREPRPAAAHRPAAAGGRFRAARGSYVERLLERFGGRVRVGAPVRAVERARRRRRGSPPTAVEAEIFDQVVIATHSDQALAMLAAPTAAEREVLGRDALPAETRRCCTPTPR